MYGLRACIATVLGLLAASGPAVAAQDFAYVREAGAVLREGAVVVDTRPAEVCGERSLSGARCLPAEAFLGPNHRLPSERDLLWLLGTAGLRGEETVLVVGQDPAARDFVAGLLYVAGQRQVRVLTEPVSRVLAGGAPAAPGRERAFTRETVFEAPMRDGLVVLRDELRRMQALLLDGRSEAEYWGETVRAARGGHLPGAVSLPALQLRASLETAAGRKPVLPEGQPVAYGHDAFEGLAYFTLLTAGHGVPARVYLEGWGEWAADGALPADAVSYPERVEPGNGGGRSDAARPAWGAFAGAMLLALAGFAGGWWMARKRAA
jgi:thiosulfate/3-mercaptopyruvate sulfurtransferase